MSEPEMGAWTIPCPTQADHKDQIILLRLAAICNSLKAADQTADIVYKHNPTDKNVLVNVFLWHMALVKEAVKTIGQHQSYFTGLLEKYTEIQTQWSHVFDAFKSTQAGTVGWLLSRIRNNVAFHWDCRAFEAVSADSEQSLLPFAQGKSKTWKDTEFPAALECIWNWVFHSQSTNMDVPRPIRALTDFSNQVCSLLQKLISARLLGELGAEIREETPYS